MHDPIDNKAIDDQPGAAEKPSKSQRKRDALALQKLGEELVRLKPAQLDKLAALLPDPLLEAILSAQSLHQRGARKRQLQYIGKLMRSVQAQPIRAALDAIGSQGMAQKRRQRDVEQLCSALLSGEPGPLNDFLQRYPNVDRQYIRQLIRNAAREKAQTQTAKSARLLQRYLRQIIEAAENG